MQTKIADISQFFCKRGIVITHAAAFDGMVNLSCMEAEHRSIAKATGALSLIAYTKGMGCIVDDF